MSRGKDPGNYGGDLGRKALGYAVGIVVEAGAVLLICLAASAVIMLATLLAK